MADPDLVDVLCRGTETWNRFRDEHPESQSPNLSRADLQGLNLTDADLHGANLTGANLADATLSRARLTEAQLSQVKAARARWAGAPPRRGPPLPSESIGRPAPDGERLSRGNGQGPAPRRQPEARHPLGGEPRGSEASRGDARRRAASPGEPASSRSHPGRGGLGTPLAL